MSRLPALTVALLVAVTGLAGCGDATAPDVVPTADGVTSTTTDSVELTLPTGVVTFDVGEPRESLPADDTADATAYDAPDGRVIVLVTWRHRTTTSDAQLALLTGSLPPPTDLSVRIDGSTTSFGTLDPVGRAPAGKAWVSVPEDGSWRIEATFEGETQSVDPTTGERDPGAAATYYLDPPSAEPAPQQLAEPAEGLTYGIAAQVDELLLVPYLADQGWAGEGKAWLVVGTEVEKTTDFTYRSGRRINYYDARVADATTTLDGTEPSSVLDEVVVTVDEMTTYAFEVPVGDADDEPTDRTLTLTRRYDLELEGRPAAPGVPATTQAEVTFTFPVTTP